MSLYGRFYLIDIMAFTKLNLVALLVVFAAVVYATDATDEPAEEIQVDEKAIDYAKGSLCGYCRYCTVSISPVCVRHYRS